MRSLLALACLVVTALAQEVRPIPPPGIAIPDNVRAELSAGRDALGKEIALLRETLAGKPELLAELPNVQILHKAVDWALRYGEFFEPQHFAAAKTQLELGTQRAKELRDAASEHRAALSWNSATGLVVRGYVSRIDGSVQPYGMVVPDGWKPEDHTPRRLDVWFRGRSEKGTELAFLEDRLKNRGEFAPAGALVLHPFGRYCNANKFAGETDLFEALADAKLHYSIDENRLVVRGFSMGGASTWQFATHHPGMLAAAAPGAGFAETAEFFKVFAPGKEPPPWWEQVLWRWYDSTLYAANLASVPTIAYSGELDGQKQAADIMSRFAEKEGLTFPHIIGPQTAHKYHPEAKPKIEEFVTAAVEEKREPFPKKVRFTTYSLLYPKMEWVWVQGMEKEWERAEITGELNDANEVQIATKNVSRFQLTKPAGGSPKVERVVVDGQKVAGADDRNVAAFEKKEGKWQRLTRAGGLLSGHYKQPGLCGPIDHAFMDKFIFVRPTGQPLNPAVGAWAKAELEHAIEFWRKVFRGDAPVKDDTALTEEDIANSNLVLWGDPSSNAVLKRMLGSQASRLTAQPAKQPADAGASIGQAGRLTSGLPLTWTAQTLEVGGVKYAAAHHAPALIFPNPLNPVKYVVLNSGPTFREQALLNNSDQTPKLPDWAIIDIRTPPGPKWPGLVVDAGFFDEQWHLPATP